MARAYDVPDKDELSKVEMLEFAIQTEEASLAKKAGQELRPHERSTYALVGNLACKLQNQSLESSTSKFRFARQWKPNFKGNCLGPKWSARTTSTSTTSSGVRSHFLLEKGTVRKNKNCSSCQKLENQIKGINKK